MEKLSTIVFDLMKTSSFHSSKFKLVNQKYNSVAAAIVHETRRELLQHFKMFMFFCLRWSTGCAPDRIGTRMCPF